MSKTAVLIIAVIALAAGAIFFVHEGDGDDGSDSYGSDDTGSPGIVGGDFGTVVLVSEEDGKARYRAVPSLGAFIGWMDDGRYLSGEFELSRASFAGIVAMFAESPSKLVSYDWRCPTFDADGNPSGIESAEVFTLSMDRATYYRSIASDEGRTATYADPMPAQRLCDDYVVDAIVGYLGPMTSGLINLQKAEVILAFVQDAISYQSDQDQYGIVEFWTTPMETMFSGLGDCEDTATLFVNIALRMGLDAGFVAFDDPVMGHMSAAVALADGESVAGATFVSEGVTYAYVETAVDNVRRDVGWLSPSFKITDGKWCHVTLDDSGYVGEKTVPIGVKTTNSRIFFYGVIA